MIRLDTEAEHARQRLLKGAFNTEALKRKMGTAPVELAADQIVLRMRAERAIGAAAEKMPRTPAQRCFEAQWRDHQDAFYGWLFERVGVTEQENRNLRALRYSAAIRQLDQHSALGLYTPPEVIAKAFQREMPPPPPKTFWKPMGARVEFETAEDMCDPMRPSAIVVDGERFELDNQAAPE